MAFTSGFFNSLKGDRKYNAEQVSEIFDGVLKDGIIPSQGQLFDVNSAENGMQITIGTGRAWFDHTWSKNDSIMVLTVEPSDITRPRYDTVVLEVNHEDAVRANSIKIVKGVASINTEKPILLNTSKVKQYPLAHIMVRAGTEEIRAADIENMVGREPTVFATGILETVAIDDLWSQWKGEWEDWFANIKLQLSGDIVTNLQYQIDQLRDWTKKWDGLTIKSQVHTNVYTSSGTFRNETGKDITVTVRLFGGGGGGAASSINGGGGGGGHMATGTYRISNNQVVNITIGLGGSGGESPTNGGTTSFGNYLSATGGSAPTINRGGDGGSGGGAGKNSSLQCSGGTASYGGGGGGAGMHAGNSSSTNYDVKVGGSGGSGGTYGGGGGGGGSAALSALDTRNNNTYAQTAEASSGGTKGANGGVGGSGGSATITAPSMRANPGNAGGSGVDTSKMGYEFIGNGRYGTGGSGSSSNNSYGVNMTRYMACGGGGGGGGGYGGVGGNGGNGFAIAVTDTLFAVQGSGGGGGGGGGYGADGGNGSTAMGDNQNYLVIYAAHGGGGGGYGGSGGNASNSGGGYSGQGYGAGGGGGMTSAYVMGTGTFTHGAGGGGGYGTTPNSSISTNGVGGVCIVTYITRELVLED